MSEPIISKSELLDKKKATTDTKEVCGVMVRIRKMDVSDLLSDSLLKLPLIQAIFQDGENAKKPSAVELLRAVVENKEARTSMRRDVCVACLLEPALTVDEFNGLEEPFKEGLFSAIMGFSGYGEENAKFFR